MNFHNHFSMFNGLNASTLLHQERAYARTPTSEVLTKLATIIVATEHGKLIMKVRFMFQVQILDITRKL